MAIRPVRTMTERELKQLTIDQLVSLIRDDIKEMDQLRPLRRDPPEVAKPAGPKGRSGGRGGAAERKPAGDRAGRVRAGEPQAGESQADERAGPSKPGNGPAPKFAGRTASGAQSHLDFAPETGAEAVVLAGSAAPEAAAVPEVALSPASQARAPAPAGPAGASPKPAAKRPVAAEPGAGRPPIFHVVTCCNRFIGEFPPIARVRCPRCRKWHRARAFPRAPHAAAGP